MERMKPLRFSLRALLILIALIAVYIAAHRIGFRKGYSKAAIERGDDQLGSYNVSDLVLPLSAKQRQALNSP